MKDIVMPAALLSGPDGVAEEHTMPRDKFAFIEDGTGIHDETGQLGGAGDGSSTFCTASTSTTTKRARAGARPRPAPPAGEHHVPAGAIRDPASCLPSSLPSPTSVRPFTTCLCGGDERCRACPLVHRCATCAARPGQRCGRPSGHRGGFVATHEDRLLQSDVAALCEQPDEVEKALRALATAPPAAALAWRRHLDKLVAQPQLWRGRVPAELLQRFRTLAHAAAVRDELVDQPSLFDAAG